MIIVTDQAKAGCDTEMLAMLGRQGQAWLTGNFSPAAAADWHEEGVLTAPGNRIPKPELARTIENFHRDYGDLVLTVTNAFCSPDGRRMALEWLWEISRREDGQRSRTEDAIIVDFDADGLILSWREYFDTVGSVEDHHHIKTKAAAKV
jgi:ketosteroid isomerase-like protein